MQSKKFILSICLFILTAFFITACSDSNSSSGGGSIEQKVTKVIMNDYTRYALFQDGSLYVWGNNQQGKLGTGDTADKRTLVKIESLDGKIIQMHYGSIPTVFALTENNTLYAWGYNYKGRLGLGLDNGEVNTPTKVESINGIIKKIYTSNYSFIYILTEDNTLYTWGDNKYGIGIENSAEYINKPEKVTGITGNIKDIYINGYATYALTDDNSLYVWGNNEHGQLGVNNTVEYVKTPTKLSGINGAVNKVYTGDSVYVITNDNAVYSFGSNEFWFEYVQYNGLLGRNGSNYEPLQVLFEK